MAKTTTASHDTLRILNIIGLYSPIKSKRTVVLSLYYIIQLIYILLVVLVQFSKVDEDILELVTNIDAFCGYGQHLGKVTVMLYSQNEFLKLLEKTKLFWKTDVICQDRVKRSLDNILAKAKKLERVFLGCTVISVFGMILYSLEEGKLPMGIWTFKENKQFFYCTQVSEIISLLCAGFGIVLFDCVFFITCIEVIIQFKILSHCLSDMSLSSVTSQKDEIEYYNKLKVYIEHHNFLLGFLRDLQSYYSPAFVTQCVTTAPLICTLIYAIMDINDPNQQIRHALTCFSIILQLSFYCITADSVSSEALTVGDAMYNSDWYSNFSPSLGKRMVMLIQKSQQPVIFTAGGLFAIKATTVLTVLRVSWSACTVIRSIKGK